MAVPTLHSPPTSWFDQFAAVVGRGHVLVDPSTTAGYAVDWTGRFRGTAWAVVRPGSTDEVVEVVSRCAAAGVPVVTQGGNTGLVGGSVPLRGGVVLSTRRLTDLEPVDEAAGQVTVGAGATLADVQAQVRPCGLELAVDLAARDSATIGGMVATNAGGLRVMRHGAMRSQVVGLEAVLADGRVFRRLHGLLKDNTGYDLVGLLCGSEGTLAVVTRVRVRLVPVLPERATALVAVDGPEEAVTLVAALRRGLASLEMAELVDRAALDLVGRAFGIGHPFAVTPPIAVLLECAGRADPLDELAEALADRPEVRDAALASDGPGRARLWAVRERCTDAVATLGIPCKLDVTLPQAELARFVTDVPGAVAAVDGGARCVLFGHVGDGNVHVNVVPVTAPHRRIEEVVLAMVGEACGSISAEHGIGTAKVPFLPLGRGPVDLELFRAVKDAFDPSHLLNPGVLVG